MIDLHYTLERMLEETNFRSQTKFKSLSTKEWKHSFAIFDYSHLKEIYHIEQKVLENPISSRFEAEPVAHGLWPFTYFQIINKIAEGATEIPLCAAAPLALENAFERGQAPVTVKSYVGTKGIVYEVEDSGSGFDVSEKVKKYKKKEIYFNGFGCGFRSYDDTGIVVSFNKKGNSCLIMLDIKGYNRQIREAIGTKTQ